MSVERDLFGTTITRENLLRVNSKKDGILPFVEAALTNAAAVASPAQPRVKMYGLGNGPTGAFEASNAGNTQTAQQPPVSTSCT